MSGPASIKRFPPDNVSTTESAALALKVDKTTTVNTKPLSGNVALTLDDVPATATKATVPPSDASKLADLAGGGWADRMMQQAQVLVPELTTFVSQRAGLYPNGTPGLFANLADAGEYGGMMSYKEPNYAPLVLTNFITPNPKTSKWAIAFRGVMNGGSAFFALTNLAFTSYITIYSITSTALIHLQVGSNVVATTFAWDSNVHDFLITFDQTTVTAVIDGNVVGTNTTLSSAPTAPSVIALVASSNTIPIKFCEYGFAYV